MNALTHQDSFIGQHFTQQGWQGLHLEDKVFCDCSFEHCQFNEAVWLKCEFEECSFTHCDLSNVQLPYSKLRALWFKDCKLLGIDWTTVSWPNVQLQSPFAFDDCLLDYCSFFGLCMKEIKIEGCQARNVNFTEANCSHACFMGSDLAGSLFHHTDLSHADFVDAHNYQINLHHNTLTKAKFSLPDAIELLLGLDIELVD